MIKTAVITARNHTCFRHVFGIPAIRRLLLTLHRVGVQNPRIVTISDDLTLDSILDLVPKQYLFPIGANRDKRRMEHLMESLDLGTTDRVMVLPANTVIDDWSLHRMIKEAHAHEITLSACGADLTLNGIYVVKDHSLPAMLYFMLGSNGHGTDLVSVSAHSPSPDTPCFIDSTERSIREAEEGLVRALSLSHKEHDSFLARHIDRPLARFLSRSIARTSIKPNAITVINLSIGIVGAFFLAVGGYWNQLLGALLFLANVMGDGIDGDVARLKLKETPFGHYLDIISDNAVHVAVFIGIGVGLARQTSNPVYVYVLPVLLGGFSICAYVINGVLRTNSEVGKGLLSLLDNRDFAYLVAVLALFGRLNWFLVGSSVGVYLVSIILLFLHFRSAFSARAMMGGSPAAKNKYDG